MKVQSNIQFAKVLRFVTLRLPLSRRGRYWGALLSLLATWAERDQEKKALPLTGIPEKALEKTCPRRGVRGKMQPSNV